MTRQSRRAAATHGAGTAHPPQPPQPASQSPGGDPWLLPDDGIIDPVAVEIAASGARRVALTATERQHAAAAILAAGGTARRVAQYLRIGRHTAQRLCQQAAALTTGRSEQGAA